MNKNSQKGISVFIALSIVGLVVIVVLGISLILASQVRISRAMGESVVAFYAADSGIEYTYYLDRKMRFEQALTGLCNLCGESDACCGYDDVCCNQKEGGYDTTCSVLDCETDSCGNCKISFSRDMGNASYRVEAQSNLSSPAQEAIIKSYGSYNGTTRAIRLRYTLE